MSVDVKQAEKFLKETKESTLVVCEKYWNKFISDNKEPWKYLQFFLENWDKVGKEVTPPTLLSVEEENDFRNKYKQLLVEIIRVVLEEKEKPDIFYKKLYKIIFENGIFPEDVKTRALLLKMMIKEIPQLPYYPVENLLILTNEEFIKEAQKIKLQLRKADGVISRGFKTRTELISQLYRIASEIENEELQIVFWSVMYFYVSRENKQLS